MSAQAKPKMKYGELKTETQYLKKLAADSVSRFGDSLDAIAYSWMVYTLTGSASMTAVTFAVNTLVTVLLSPFTGALITSMSKKSVIVLCDIGRGVMVAATAFLYLLGWIQPWMIIAITGLNSTLEAFRNPAGAAIFPQIISREKFTLGMSLSGALSRAFELIGMGMAGVLLGTMGIAGVLLIDAGTFFFSAVMLSTLKVSSHKAEAAQNLFGEFVRNTKEGFAYARTSHVVMALCMTACFLNFSLTPMNALQAAYVSESLQLGAEALSVTGVSFAVGMMLGSLLVPKLLEKMHRFTLLFSGALGISVGFFFLAFVPGLPQRWIWTALITVYFIMGVGAAFANTVAQISFMEKIDEQYLARMNGIMSSFCMAAVPVASFISAGLAKVLSVPHILLVFGILSVAGTISFRLVKPLREL